MRRAFKHFELNPGGKGVKRAFKHFGQGGKGVKRALKHSIKAERM